MHNNKFSFIAPCVFEVIELFTISINFLKGFKDSIRRKHLFNFNPIYETEAKA